MWKIVVTDEFKRRYSLLLTQLKRKAEKQERLFCSNPFYPSLHTEKLEPKGKQIWTIRVDSNFRITFKFVDKDTVAFMTVGPYDWIYRVWFNNQ